MRTSKINDSLKVNAIAGTYVVTLGFDLPMEKCVGLLGFSILRTDKTGRAKFLKGMKCFAETDPGFPAVEKMNAQRQRERDRGDRPEPCLVMVAYDHGEHERPLEDADPQRLRLQREDHTGLAAKGVGKRAHEEAVLGRVLQIHLTCCSLIGTGL